MKSLVGYISGIILLFAGLLAKGQDAGNQNDRVTLYLGWTHQFQFAGYYAAIEKGYFSEVGLDVTLVPETGEDNIEAVINGDFDYGVATGATLLAHPQYDDITVLAAIFQQSPVSLLALKSRGINTLRDLNGADLIGGTEIAVMLASAGVDLHTVKFHGNYSRFSDLISGKYDAISYFMTDKAKLLGNDSLLFNIFRPIEYGVNFYGECLFTSRQRVTQHPEQAKKIRDAAIKGWQYAVQHQDEIIDLILDKYNPDFTREELSSEAEIIIHSLVLPRFYDVGDMQFSKWQQMADLMYDLGIISSKRNLEGFIFTTTTVDPGKLKKVITMAAIIIAVAAAILLGLLMYNRQLQKAVKSRTVSLERANREMDRFVYSISHDIRSPLSSIQGLINLMKADKDAADNYLNLIEASVVKLDKYTKDILDYTRNSRTRVSFKQIDLAELIDKCSEQVRYLGEDREVVFKKEITLNEQVWADPWRMEVIFNNLLSNAIKYCDKEKDKTIVEVKAWLEEGDLQLVIADNGVGISEEHLGKLYDMFYRASEDSQGSGMGLFIVKETINHLKGSIRLESTVKKGTTIFISLPNRNPATKEG